MRSMVEGGFRIRAARLRRPPSTTALRAAVPLVSVCEAMRIA
jgi:hypothetical protein